MDASRSHALFRQLVYWPLGVCGAAVAPRRGQLQPTLLLQLLLLLWKEHVKLHDDKSRLRQAILIIQLRSVVGVRD